RRRIDNQKVAGRYYLHQYHQVAVHTYRKPDQEPYSTGHSFDLLVNDIWNKGPVRVAAGSRMNYSQSLSMHANHYDPAFWESYNVIRQSPADEKIISDLKSSTSEEDIFDRN